MTSETWVKIPMDEIVWSRIFDPQGNSFPSTDGVLAAGGLKCPKCGTGVRWTSSRFHAEACLCAVQWVVVRATVGGILLKGSPEAIEEIRKLLAP